MTDDRDIFQKGLGRFRTGGIAIAVLPLLLGVGLLLAGNAIPAVMMIILSVLLLFLVLWATYCAEDLFAKLQAARQDRR